MRTGSPASQPVRSLCFDDRIARNITNTGFFASDWTSISSCFERTFRTILVPNLLALRATSLRVGGHSVTGAAGNRLTAVALFSVIA